MNMRILIVIPAFAIRQSGNSVTARRWRSLLQALGHRVTIDTAYTSQPCDVLIALHARRSARSVLRYRQQFPAKPLILAMTGTDLYRDLERSEAAQRSMQLASRIVLLQLDGLACLPKPQAHKARVVYQSAIPPRSGGQPLQRVFEVCVVGHLRSVKDPFRAAMAARRLPAGSRIRILHLGRSLQASLQRRALAEMDRNPRYRWLGERSWSQTRQHIARARLVVVSSKMEGGANVVSESLVAETPLLASRVSGNVGLLGKDYPGYFPVGDTQALADLMLRAETDAEFYRSLREHCAARKHLVQPEKEKRDWDELLGEFLWEACGSRGST
jgi:putative glycosyltransferase (TIGR04348 family)